jgi:hypothetical protein
VCGGGVVVAAAVGVVWMMVGCWWGRWRCW